MIPWEPIPGETPIDDVSVLKLAIRTRSELNDAEAANIRRAVVKYLSKRPSRRTAKFDLAWLLRLHREMFGDVWKWAGTVRVRPVNIGVPFYQIQLELQKLLGDLSVWGESRMDLVEQAARLHYRAVAIHPFLNGNGRWSRLLANIWLRLNRVPLTNWPDDAIGTESCLRAEYIAAIKEVDLKGDYDPLIAMHRRFSG